MPGNNVRSPLITHLSWGNMTIEDVGSGKDFKLWPGGGRPWDWNETGTRHMPGIQPTDIEELLEHGAEHIVLSRGMLLALQTCPETRSYLRSRNIRCQIAETRKARDIYNQLAGEHVAVGGLFHSTC
ncbi:MAG TPA: Mth938-like domain-containing protein, partial [Gammaproteobacteria bacterium]|nr:Mth938-like domain-containing protein [Gammaproteobacteria bacterium]